MSETSVRGPRPFSCAAALDVATTTKSGTTAAPTAIRVFHLLVFMALLLVMNARRRGTERCARRAAHRFFLIAPISSGVPTARAGSAARGTLCIRGSCGGVVVIEEGAKASPSLLR